MYIEDIAPMSPTPDMNGLLELVDKGEAKMVVNYVNHREFVWNGKRYFVGWQSDSKQYNCKRGWFTYDVQDETIPNQADPT